ncbi:MAG: hypothetical protein ACRD0C_19660 [Acidimicrobiia bacterium]
MNGKIRDSADWRKWSEQQGAMDALFGLSAGTREQRKTTGDSRAEPPRGLPTPEEVADFAIARIAAVMASIDEVAGDDLALLDDASFAQLERLTSPYSGQCR